MARKLKSDKVLFTATLLLVCASIVMVYSASAVVALERYHQPYLFLIKQAMWALARPGAAADRDADRLPPLPRAGRSSGRRSGLSTLALVAVLFSPRINGARRWFGVGGLGVQPSELAKLAVVFFIAALLERRMHRINDVRLLAAADRAGRRQSWSALILLEPDFGTAMSLLLIVAVMVFAAGLNYRYIVGTGRWSRCRPRTSS